MSFQGDFMNPKSFFIALALFLPLTSFADADYVCSFQDAVASVHVRDGDSRSIHVETPLFSADVVAGVTKMNGDIVAIGDFNSPAQGTFKGGLLVSQSLLDGEATAYFKTFAGEQFLTWNCVKKQTQ
jgi:hypothetical protein